MNWVLQSDADLKYILDCFNICACQSIVDRNWKIHQTFDALSILSMTLNLNLRFLTWKLDRID